MTPQGYGSDIKKVNFCKNGNHNSVQICYNVRNQNFGSQPIGYSIPQHGTFFTHFRLAKPAERVVFIVGGIEIISYTHLTEGEWHKIYDFPVNVYKVPYGQRFLNITYYKKDACLSIDILYLDTNDEMHRAALSLAGL
jgi:hypothetical protein